MLLFFWIPFRALETAALTMTFNSLLASHLQVFLAFGWYEQSDSQATFIFPAYDCKTLQVLVLWPGLCRKQMDLDFSFVGLVRVLCRLVCPRLLCQPGRLVLVTRLGFLLRGGHPLNRSPWQSWGACRTLQALWWSDWPHQSLEWWFCAARHLVEQAQQFWWAHLQETSDPSHLTGRTWGGHWALECGAQIPKS